MNCAPTLTADEFKTVHNSVWELDCVIRRLEAVIKPELFEQLSKARDGIRKGLEGAYQQDSDAFERKSNHYDRTKELLGLQSIWSIYEINELSAEHPFEGATKVVYRDHWGKGPVECAINGFTWAALWVAADACIRDSGDDHHIFVERFRPSKEDPSVLLLSTGS